MRPIALCIALLLPIGLGAQHSAIPRGNLVRVEIPTAGPAVAFRPSTGNGPVLVVTTPRFDTAAGAGLFDAVMGAIAKAEDWTTIVPGTVRIAVRPLMRKSLGIGLSLDF